MMRPDNRFLFALGFILAPIVIVGAIAWGQLGAVPVRLSRATAPVALDVHLGPCEASRYRTACDAWEAHGWPPCTLDLNGWAQVRELHGGELPTPEHAAAVGPEIDADGKVQRWVLGHSVAHCDPRNLTIEHEIGHLYGLKDGGPAGSIMAVPFPLANLQRSDDSGTVPMVSRVGDRYPEAPK